VRPTLRRTQDTGRSSPPFEIPAEIRAAWDRREKAPRPNASGARVLPPTVKNFLRWQPIERRMAGDLPAGFDDLLRAFAGGAQSEGKSLATRQSSQATLNAIGPSLPELLGGSADLTPSNGTWRKDSVTLSPVAPAGNYIHYGVREFGMSAVMNGITAHGGSFRYGGTFLTFSDYARNAVRMACLMRIRVIFVYTHDSIGLGEDGPRISRSSILQVCGSSHISICGGRAMRLKRLPCGAVALDNRDRPTLLVLTRQGVHSSSREPAQVANITRGGYVLHRVVRVPEAIVIATGSEVGIAAEACAA